jgi:hypothetical protein
MKTLLLFLPSPANLPQSRFTLDHLARRDGGERTGRRNSQRGHRLAHDVLTQDRPERSPTIAPTRERRRPETLQLEIAPHALSIDQLAKQDRPTISGCGT